MLQIAWIARRTASRHPTVFNGLLTFVLLALAATEISAQTGPLPPGTKPQSFYTPQSWAAHNPCTHPAAVAPRTRFDLTGFQGRPYRDQLPGGCECGNPRGVTRCSDASVYWSAPGSALAQQRNPARDCWWETSGRQQFFAPLDRLGNFQGLPFRRSDDGYCGPAADPYGCLSASRQSGR